MSNNTVYRPTGPHIVHDRFDDEVVIIDLESGLYFSLRGTAAEIWDLLAAGAGRDGLKAGMRAGYPGAGAELEAAVDAFVDELLAERLIAVAPAAGSPAGPGPGVEPGRGAFAAPRLVKYEDQKELLLLDPIHEVGDLGWPEKK